MPYSLDIQHDGRMHSISVPDLSAPRCAHCGEIVLDDPANRQITEAFRQQIGLLKRPCER